ncbi:MAG: DUF445 family protein [Neisseriaceae bacterium]|jgi:uncharacterized membrane protein YheB (UPF0754 family)|nr:MAG: DUF445 family protein [Neisseriaceae bacterium]
MWDVICDRVVECLTGPDRWSYIAIPFVSAFIGWVTNWKAIKLTFYPKTFWGIPPFLGWQGIVPRKAEKMAGMAIDLITSKLLSIDEIFGRIDPQKMAEAMRAPMLAIAPSLIHETMEEYAPKIWESLPAMVRHRIVQRAMDDLPQVIADIIDEMRVRPAEVLDLRQMVIDACKRDPALLNRIFQTVGKNEFRFIEISGIIFGLPLGILQMFAWFFVQPWWFLPIGGALAGGFTNWLAILMIFSPKHPRKFGPFTLHGLFMRRQNEVAVAYSKMVADELLNPQNIIDGILKGPLSDGVFRIISKHVKTAIDKEAGLVKPFLQFMIGTQTYIEMKNRAVDKIMLEVPRLLKNVHDYSKQAMDIETSLREKLIDLPVEDFEDMLHPVFKEDEWILVALGTALGGLVGFLQWHFGF